jgi:Prealbumin-like fold domain
MFNINTVAGYAHKAFAFVAAFAMLVSVMPIQTFAQGNPNQGSGSVWTNLGPCGSPQNVNQYKVGQDFYGHGDNFTPNTQYTWVVKDTGNNGATLRSGQITTDQNGDFCEKLFTIANSDIGGPYQFNVGDAKNDNFKIEAATPTTGKLTVTKIVVNNGGGTAQPNDFLLKVGNTSVLSGVANDFAPGNYVVSETNLTNYSAGSWGGDCAANGSISLVAGDVKSCTITNTYVPPVVLGCTDPTANNYNSAATQNDGSCTYDVLGCTDPTADNYNPAANVDDNSCTYPVSGCTDSDATNYNPDATVDDGSCTYLPDPILGCTDPTANNYNSAANQNDGSCTYDVLGCTDITANNFNPAANKDDGSCTYDPAPILGCTDPTAENYNPAATVDDQSCRYDNGGGPDLCTVTIVSDTNDFVIEKGANAQELTFIHDAWDAVLGAAEWIWGDDPVVTSSDSQTQTFRKQFGFVGDVTSATLEIASDNGHSATVNGGPAKVGGSSFGSAVSYNVTSEINESGNNELLIAVTNDGAVSDPQTNPAGLKYRLTIEGEVTSDADCSIAYIPPTPEVDTYRIKGYVWHDDNRNTNWDGFESEEEQEDVEDSLEGWTVNITNGSTNLSTTTDESGFYYFNVPAGTWTITEVVKNGWDRTTQESHVVTVPVVPVVTLLDSIFNLILPTAHAALVGTYGDYNFGNDEEESNGGGGGGSRLSRPAPTPTVAGEATSTPEVLGEQVSIVPVGAPATGNGGMSGIVFAIGQLLVVPRRFEVK